MTALVELAKEINEMKGTIKTLTEENKYLKARVSEKIKDMHKKKVTFKEGDLCVFSDDDNHDEPPFVSKFSYMARDKFVAQAGSSWNKCKLYQGPEILRYIEHDGGECPVSLGVLVVAKFSKDYGPQAAVGRADDFGESWTDGTIVGYAVLNDVWTK